MNKEVNHSVDGVLFRPLTGSILAVASGLSFFFLCMILPLVGPAGSKVDHALKNKAAFLGALLVTLLLAALASYSKLMRRKVEGGSLPHYSLGLCGVCILTLLVLLLNGFAI
jgi:ABC-type transport system involved in cytochrome c biogenesis permease component